MQTYTLSAKKLLKFQKYENTKSFKITNFIEKIALQYTFYWFFFCGITDYKLKIKPRQQVHYNSNLNSKMISNFNKYLLPFLYNSSH